MSDNDELREVGKQLPWDKPDAARREAVRSALLVAAAEGTGRVGTRWPVVAGAFALGAIAAAAAVLLVVRRPVAESHAQIEASASADFERAVVGTSGEEVVRVHRGKLSVAPGAKVHFVTNDADVEGAGAIEIVARDDRLAEVSVKSGSAAVRVSGQQAVFLAAGQVWKAKPQVVAETIEPPKELPAVIEEPEPAAVDRKPPAEHPQPAPAPMPVPAVRTTAPVAPAPDAAPAPEPAPVAAAEPAPEVASTTPKNQLEQHFQLGYALLKAGKSADAARELGAAADAGGDDPLAADARYFQAIALVRAGRKTEAEHALVAFLDRAPKSIRRGRAVITLAHLISERGDTASARNWYESALADADPDVVSAARAGIAALK